MKTELLRQLEKEEKELLKRLEQIRKEKLKLIRREEVTVTFSGEIKDYKRSELETMSKSEVVKISETLNIPLNRNKTKKEFIDAIIRNLGAKARGRAFAKMVNPS